MLKLKHGPTWPRSTFISDQALPKEGVAYGRKNIWKWALQVFLPLILFITYEQTQTEPFSSEHVVARHVILIGLYSAWHIYVDLVRKGRL